MGGGRAGDVDGATSPIARFRPIVGFHQGEGAVGIFARFVRGAFSPKGFDGLGICVEVGGSLLVGGQSGGEFGDEGDIRGADNLKVDGVFCFAVIANCEASRLGASSGSSRNGKTRLKRVWSRHFR